MKKIVGKVKSWMYDRCTHERSYNWEILLDVFLLCIDIIIISAYASLAYKLFGIDIFNFNKESIFSLISAVLGIPLILICLVTRLSIFNLVRNTVEKRNI